MDIMFDLETAGTSARAAPLSIGAVAFDRFGYADDLQSYGGDAALPLYRTFYRNIALQSALTAGLEVSGATFAWWLHQSDAARAALLSPAPVPLREGLAALAAWCGPWLRRGGCVWSHGATFDLVILKEALARFGVESPWKFYKERDTRTLFDACGHEPGREARGLHHHALHDAVAQARGVQWCFNELGRLRTAAALPALPALPDGPVIVLPVDVVALEMQVTGDREQDQY